MVSASCGASVAAPVPDEIWRNVGAAPAGSVLTEEDLQHFLVSFDWTQTLHTAAANYAEICKVMQVRVQPPLIPENEKKKRNVLWKVFSSVFFSVFLPAGAHLRWNEGRSRGLEPERLGGVDPPLPPPPGTSFTVMR